MPWALSTFLKCFKDAVIIQVWGGGTQFFSDANLWVGIGNRKRWQHLVKIVNIRIFTTLFMPKIGPGQKTVSNNMSIKTLIMK